MRIFIVGMLMVGVFVIAPLCLYRRHQTSVVFDDLSLDRAPLTCHLGSCRLKVRFVSRAVCYNGDLDLIREALKHEHKQEFLLSLESLLQPAEWPARVKKIAIDQLSQSFEETLTFSQPDTASLLGLFLCIDATGTGSCGTKPPPDADGAASSPGSDRTFYFQPFIAESSALDYLRDLSQVSAAPLSFTKRATYLKERNPDRDGRGIEAALDHAMSRLLMLRPIPVSFQNGTAIVDLPRYDESACQG